ncbi:Bromodomain-containing protein [Massariosphaeria phaeospora]|uniref:Bromodomain-containing protein n=1 Tax=Massariosphaeria phaeospora TaxID=100035 RepID=A0A7C8I2Z9_9PLEO|nr:Bromodomain-containing protein [Massariosphaeria phaeospora]
MESAAKRKATGAAASENEGRPSKRQKVPSDPDAVTETVETATAMGIKFLESLKAAKDKTGRPIATHFLSLPDQSKLPEYYEVIKLPIAVDTIEAKLKNGGYNALAQVESDCKRLVNNAKAYNDKKSLIYEDAERLRKTASNWMVKHNPAYRLGDYVAVATPIPGEEATPPGKPIPRIVPASTPKPVAVAATPDTSERPRRAATITQQNNTPAPSRLRKSAVVANDGGSGDFTGKSFQHTQEQIVRELVDYKEGGVPIFAPFVNLPSRSLKDYYQLIKNPMSITAVQKRVRGVIGRNAPTGHTDLKSWQAFADEMSWIWKNARDYNEDGSEMYNLSLKLEVVFTKRLEEAKSKVEEPPQQKLKLNMSVAAPPPPSSGPPKPQLKLKLRQSPGSDPNTPVPRTSAPPSVIVDNAALLRQQQHVLDSMTSKRSSRPPSSGKTGTPSASANPFSGPRGATTTIAPIAAPQTRAAGSPAVVNGFKNDIQSPALTAIRPASNTSDGQSQRQSVPAQTPMPPPQTTSRTTSGSPHPNGAINHQTATYPQYNPPNYYVPPTTPQFENIRKSPLKSISEALIPKITLTTHPALNLPQPFSVTIPAHKEKTVHSVTMNLRPTHSYLQIVPFIPVALTHRLYRIFVTVNGNKTYEVNRVPVTAGINGASIGPGYEGGKKKGEPVYEAKLGAGVNRVEIEIIAERDRKGKPESKDVKEQVEVEKCTIFLHLARS